MNKLNFGCGKDIREGWENADIQKNDKIDFSFDFNKFPYPLKKNYYDFICIDNVLEHLKDPEKVLYELWKSCKKGGIIEIIVPYYNNKGAYTDLTHLHYFSEQSFIKFAEEPYSIEKKKKFQIREIQLIPTRTGKLFPGKIREKASLFIGGLVSKVYVKLEVIK